MDFTDWQEELLTLLAQRGLPREEVFPVMLVLTKEEKGRKMIAFLKERAALTPDEIREAAGKIAFDENLQKNS